MGHLHWIVRALIEKNPLPKKFSKEIIPLANKLKIYTSQIPLFQQSIFYFGSCESELSRLLKKILKKGSVFIDCGANIGELSIRASECVGASGKVLAIEPMPQTANVIRHNIALNNLKNTEVIQKAVGGSVGERQIYFKDDAAIRVDNSFFQFQEHYKSSIKILVTSLDVIVDEERLDQIDVIKLDVEGAEMEALSGAKKLLTQETRRPFIIFEYHKEVASRAGWSFRDIYKLLQSLNYEVRYITKGNLGKIIEEADINDLEKIIKNDYIAVPIKKCL